MTLLCLGRFWFQGIGVTDMLSQGESRWCVFDSQSQWWGNIAEHGTSGGVFGDPVGWGRRCGVGRHDYATKRDGTCLSWGSGFYLYSLYCSRVFLMEGFDQLVSFDVGQGFPAVMCF